MNDQSLPAELIKVWPEILSDITVRAIPVEYLHSLKIFFKNGRIWELPVTAKYQSADLSSLSASLEELLMGYSSNVESLDFQIDIKKVKKDSIRVTNKYFK